MKGMFTGKFGYRKDSSRSVRTALVAVVLVAALSTGIGAISASADRKVGKSNSTKLTGSWMVSVDRGPSQPPLKSLQTYTRGHGVVEISNGGATARSPGHGAWQRLGGRNYGTTVVFFRYDPASGAYLGTVKIRHRLVMAPGGQSFSGVAVAELRDPQGNLLPGSNLRRDAISAQRINVEPVPN